MIFPVLFAQYATHNVSGTSDVIVRPGESKSRRAVVKESNLENSDTDKQLRLASEAARGDVHARQQINALVEPIIAFQTNCFCKRFCRENRYRYYCTLPEPWGSLSEGASYCEWGNASYSWMLDDLTNTHRLTRYQARHGSSLYNYIYQIANSLPFYERWKDWRFGRKVHVPTYIQEMGPLAARVFLGLHANHEVEHIAQTLGESLEVIEKICQRIISALTQRKRLYLLNPSETISLTRSSAEQGEQAADDQMDIVSYDELPELVEQKILVKHAWEQLSAVEQFVLEALVIEDQDASSVLDALKTLGLSIKQGVPADKTDRQQLYYFRRKTLAKLAGLMKHKNND